MAVDKPRRHPRCGAAAGKLIAATKEMLTMGMVSMRIWDVTGSRSQVVESPDDIEVARLLVILVERMGLPLNSPDGQLMSYKLHHKRTGQQLLDNQPLAAAGVRDGDDLRLQPEITAGR